jgi:hypothetical protein
MSTLTVRIAPTARYKLILSSRVQRSLRMYARLQALYDGSRLEPVDPDLLAFIPRPVLAVLMLFPSDTEGYRAAKAKEDGEIQADEAKSKFGQDFMYFRQVSLFEKAGR